MINIIHTNTKERMKKSLDTLKNQISKIRTGYASPNILDNIMVEYYGMPVPIRQLSNITVENANTLLISIFDNKAANAIKKAILTSNLDLNPSLIGNIIRVKIPPLTEERRRKIIKIIKNDAEQNRIAIRNIRRDANDKIKSLFKNKEITEDDEKRSQNYIQKITDDFIKKIDKILIQKETELLKF
ncbi:Ribosome-recycling factor [Candidatus Providencia siddallii]|uniref:Ribosome-recycling factor n=1 Tax=Candidatus Providencia siddallii TaxID=1715285 RepID=A0A0M6W8R6_9GAMM|nr:Ribosome-recycling factor [Candidatus Providencia siddallii]